MSSLTFFNQDILSCIYWSSLLFNNMDQNTNFRIMKLALDNCDLELFFVVVVAIKK